MNLRLAANEARLRLSEAEARTLDEHGALTETLVIGDWSLRIEIRLSQTDAPALVAQLSAATASFTVAASAWKDALARIPAKDAGAYSDGTPKLAIEIDAFSTTKKRRG